MIPVELAGWLESSLVIITIAFGAYFALYQLFYVTIVIRAIGAIADERRWASDELLSGTFASPLTPGVSVLVPAHNESAGSVACVEAILDYPAGRSLLNARETNWNGTPLSWCCHGSRHCGNANADHAGVAKVLIAAGAEITADMADWDCSDPIAGVIRQVLGSR